MIKLKYGYYIDTTKGLNDCVLMRKKKVIDEETGVKKVITSRCGYFRKPEDALRAFKLKIELECIQNYNYDLSTMHEIYEKSNEAFEEMLAKVTGAKR